MRYKGNYPMPPAELRILVVAEDSLARAGMSALVAELPGCAVAGQVSGAAGFVDDLDMYRPDVVIWDTGAGSSMPPERLTAAGESGVPVIILAADEDSALAASYHGPRGVLPRDVEGQALLAAIQAAAEGLTTIGQRFSDTILRGRAPFRELVTEPLTSRELEVLQLVAQGMTNKAISLRLSISEHTAKFHVNSILGKLGASSRAEAVAVGTRLGLVRL